MHETQATIAQWADATFGAVDNPIGHVTRAMKEMAELAMCLANDLEDPKAIEEAADVVICLTRLGEKLQDDLLRRGDWFASFTRKTAASAVAEANELLASLYVSMLHDDESRSDRHSYAAGVVGQLIRFARARGEIDLQKAIDAKMAINRRREWRLDGHGHGYHIKAIESAAVASHRAEEFARELDQEP